MSIFKFTNPVFIPIVTEIQKNLELQPFIQSVQERFSEIFLDSVSDYLAPFGSSWDPLKNSICFSKISLQQEDIYDKISDVVFELFNGLSTHEYTKLIDQAKNNEINKETYVRSVEKIEHANCLKLMDIMGRAYPDHSKKPYIEDFELYYKYHILTQHSKIYAQQYDKFNAFSVSSKELFLGPWPSLPKEEKLQQFLGGLLSLKYMSEHVHDDFEKSKLQKEIGKHLVRAESYQTLPIYSDFLSTLSEIMSKEEVVFYKSVYKSTFCHTVLD
ncbi:MAG: hypothetical protein WCG10_07240 [Chlamydiota bacterium]